MPVSQRDVANLFRGMARIDNPAAPSQEFLDTPGDTDPFDATKIAELAHAIETSPVTTFGNFLPQLVKLAKGFFLP